MKLYLKFDISTICKKIIEKQMDELEMNYSIIGYGEVEISGKISNTKLKQLEKNLNNYGIEIVENQKSILVQKIKDAIIEMVYMDEKLNNSKISDYLANKLQYSFGHISNIFSEVTFTSVENYIILQKIERAKQMIIINELNFTEIAFKLNYSSAAHFSTQFKNATGLTPTAFQRIINKKEKQF
ncbi:MAG: helix-turn-helix transcriptional regulator [Bacteroidetes bacterium]|nr:helix-turn-helix transcriptional regulator [Bacteroidota bacterium]